MEEKSFIGEIMYLYSRLSDTGNFYIEINVKSLRDVIQRDELIKLGHTRITGMILLLYAFQIIVAGLASSTPSCSPAGSIVAALYHKL